MSQTSETLDPQAMWEKADWETLGGVTLTDLETLEGRGRLALFVAAAQIHLGNELKANMMVRQALDWGAAQADMIGILSAGLHNTAGRIALLLGDNDQATSQFSESVGPAATGADAAELAFVRRFHEMMNLGLLSEAAKTLSAQVADLEKAPVIPEWASVLDSKIEHMNHVLSLSLARGQLTENEAASGLEDDPKEFAKRHSTAQIGQDVWVLEQSEFKRGGFFVEFGATNGILLSNTYLLETSFGWQGICAEPNPNFFAQLERNRRCTVSSNCIAGETGKTVRFIAADEYGGIEDYGNDDIHADKRQAYAKQGHVLDLETISLHDFLRSQGAPRTIDYLSIDTEGSEYDILAAFPFDEWDIRLITVEHNFTPIREEIAQLLEGHGYIRTKVKWDDWYAKPDKENA